MAKKLAKPSLEQKVDRLTVELRRGFARVDDRLTKVDERFTKTDEKIDRLAGAVKQGFDEVDKRFENVEHRMSIMEKDLAAVRFMITELVYRDEFKKLELRVERLEQKLRAAPAPVKR